MHVSTEKNIVEHTTRKHERGQVTYIKYEAEDWYKTAINSHKVRSASLKVT